MNHFEMDSPSFEDMLGNYQEPDNGSKEIADIENSIAEDLVDDSQLENIHDPINEESSEGSSEDDNENDNEDFLGKFLKDYGLVDKKVTYQNEDGSTEEVAFDDLDPGEKLNILRQLTTPNLSKDEIGAINYMRKNNATMKDIADYFYEKGKVEGKENYIKENGPIQKNYTVDEYTDDELYVADLKSKYQNMTDEEIQIELDTAKENEELFKKKIETIRNQYKLMEDKEAQEIKLEKENQYNDFKNAIKNQLTNFNEVSMNYRDVKSDSLQIENEEKDEIFKYILDQDENGATQFFKDLNNPEKLVEMAWFSLYGKDAISDISTYWKSQLKNERRSETKPQTTVVRENRQQIKKDKYINPRNSVETDYGESLL